MTCGFYTAENKEKCRILTVFKIEEHLPPSYSITELKGKIANETYNSINGKSLKIAATILQVYIFIP